MADEWREDIGMVAVQISHQVVLAREKRLSLSLSLSLSPHTGQKENCAVESKRETGPGKKLTLLCNNYYQETHWCHGLPLLLRGFMGFIPHGFSCGPPAYYNFSRVLPMTSLLT